MQFNKFYVWCSKCDRTSRKSRESSQQSVEDKMFLQLAKYNYAQFYGIDVCKVRNEHVTTGLNIGNRKSCLESWVVAVPTSQDRTESRESSNDKPIISTNCDRNGRSGPLISGMRRFQLKKQSQDYIS